VSAPTLTATAGTTAVAEVVSPAPRDEWAALVTADPASMVDHSPAWMDVITATSPFEDASRLYRFADGRRMVLPLARRRGALLSFPDGWGIGGLVGDPRNADAVTAVLADLAAAPALLTRVRPDPLEGDLWATAGAAVGATARPRCAHVIDLTVGIDGLWDGLHRSARRSVTKARTSGLAITDEATPAHLAAYYRLYLLSLDRWAERSREPRWLARRRGIRRDPLRKLEVMADVLGDRFRLWLAWLDGEPVAGSIVLLGNAGHATRGAIDRERAAPTRASHLLEWLALEEAVAEGSTVQHLGESGNRASLSMFKESFGARPVVYADHTLERLPVTAADRHLRTGVKRLVGFRDDPA